MKSQKNQLIQQMSKVGGGADLSSSGNTMDKKEVTKKFKWLKNTSFKSTQLMHPQDRNIHGKVFGGHIIKTSFDLAWIAASCFFGTDAPVK